MYHVIKVHRDNDKQITAITIYESDLTRVHALNRVSTAYSKQLSIIKDTELQKFIRNGVPVQ